MSVSDTFDKNVKSVEKLVNFDRHVLGMAISSIETLHDRLVQPPLEIDNEKLNGKRTLDQLKQIRKNDSLKLYYSTINNQAVVLLVSYFGSAVADLFRQASESAVHTHEESYVLNAEIKLSVKDLIEFQSTDKHSVGNILIGKSNISFQDMKSIQREFKSYFGISIEKDEEVNNIILSQACRHSIVHEAAIVNQRVINQVKNAKPRAIKDTLVLYDEIVFNQEEIDLISLSMKRYVGNLESQVRTYSESV